MRPDAGLPAQISVGAVIVGQTASRQQFAGCVTVAERTVSGLSRACDGQDARPSGESGATICRRGFVWNCKLQIVICPYMYAYLSVKIKRFPIN